MPDSSADDHAYQAWRARLTNRRTLLSAQRLPLACSPAADHRLDVKERRYGRLADIETINDLLRLTPDESRMYWDDDLLLVCPRGCQSFKPTVRDEFGWPVLADCPACGSPLSPADEE